MILEKNNFPLIYIQMISLDTWLYGILCILAIWIFMLAVFKATKFIFSAIDQKKNEI